MDDKAKEKLLKKAYDLAFKYEEQYGGCGQCVVAALQDTFDMPNPDVFKSLSGYAGGGAVVGDAGCGAYVAGILFLSGLKGRQRDNFADPERVRFESFANARKLHRKFIDDFGSVLCREMQMKLFGRPPTRSRRDEEIPRCRRPYDPCPDVCGKAARWAADIAITDGLIAEEKLNKLAK